MYNVFETHELYSAFYTLPPNWFMLNINLYEKVYMKRTVACNTFLWSKLFFEYFGCLN